jgi:hypothetical protein
MDEMDSFDIDEMGDYEDTTVGDVRESIETNMWLAEAYFAQGADGLARECLRAAWLEHLRFHEILSVYAGPSLGDKLRNLMVERCDDLLRELDPVKDRLPPGKASWAFSVAAA